VSHPICQMKPLLSGWLLCRPCVNTQETAFHNENYFTPNPINPPLFMRAPNRLCSAVAGQFTRDTDITCRRWLPININPKRPAGVLATLAALGTAMAVRNEINRHLAERGWLQPVTALSGNGIDVLYRIDLPADDGGLVQRVHRNAAGHTRRAIPRKERVSLPAPRRARKSPGSHPRSHPRSRIP